MQKRGSVRVILKIVVPILLVLAAVIGVIVYVSRPATPGDFYETPDAMPSEPGQLIDSEDFTERSPPAPRPT